MSDLGIMSAGKVLTGRAGLEGIHEDTTPVWIKVLARDPLVCCLLAAEYFAYEGHFVAGAMRPCPGYELCMHCRARTGKKGRVVFPMYHVGDRRAGLLEVSPGTAGEVLTYCEQAGFSRGLLFTFRKAGRRETGKIEVACNMQVLPEAALPEAPDAAAILRKQWSMPERERSPWRA